MALHRLYCRTLKLSRGTYIKAPSKHLFLLIGRGCCYCASANNNNINKSVGKINA